LRPDDINLRKDGCTFPGPGLALHDVVALESRHMSVHECYVSGTDVSRGKTVGGAAGLTEVRCGLFDIDEGIVRQTVFEKKHRVGRLKYRSDLDRQISSLISFEFMAIEK